MVVLQWLTYAFWGWTVLALSVLTSMVVANFVTDTDIGSGTAYGIAAVLVLLPISYICDYFYSKKEPTHKAGAETIVMVIHAVLFALFGIGALVVSVFSVISLMISSTDSDATLVTLISGLIIAAYYGLTFLRTLNPVSFGWIQRYYKYFMLATISVIVVLGIVGPVAKERSLRDDKLIVNSLPSVNESIQTYKRTNGKLPTSLSQLNLDDDSKQLVDRKMVTYKPGSLIDESTSKDYKSLDISGRSSTTTTKVFSYELCVTYKEKENNGNGGGYGDVSANADDDGYATYLSTYNHPAGDVCYKLKTYEY